MKSKKISEIKEHPMFTKLVVSLIVLTTLTACFVHNDRKALAKTDSKDQQVEVEGEHLLLNEITLMEETSDDDIDFGQLSLLQLQVNAIGIYIENKPVFHVASEEEANKILQMIKESYLIEKKGQEIPFIQENERERTSMPTLRENETRIIDVSIKQKVSVKEEKISPTDILTVDEAVKFLQKGTLIEKIYEVKEGDVLGTIATAHELSTKKLLELNKGLKEDTILAIGQKLKVTETESLVDVMITTEERKREKIAFKEEIIEDDTLFKGETKVKQEGQNGERIITYVITETNGDKTDVQEKDETVLKEVTPKITIKGTKVIPSRGDGTFAWPAQGGYVSSKMGSRWGKFHKGIDIARPNGSKILAADNGIVESAGFNSSGYGNKVVINHQNGYKTIYAHLKSISVRAGETIPKGASIGEMGSTGDSTGVHLHFELYKNGSLVNPLDYLK